jgi:hypothetical protein
MTIKETAALTDFLRYKRKLKKQLALMSEAEYAAEPIGFEVYGYIDRLLNHYGDKEMKYILKNQDALMRAFCV